MSDNKMEIKAISRDLEMIKKSIETITTTYENMIGHIIKKINDINEILGRIRENEK